jgi:hypothetical protein
MSPNPLAESIFKATTEGRMTNVTAQPGGCIDIWPYAKMIQASVELPQQVIDGQFVKYVYRSQFNHYDHVLVPFGRSNTFLVIVVDRLHGSVYGHRVLDLNAEYGLAEPQPPPVPDKTGIEFCLEDHGPVGVFEGAEPPRTDGPHRYMPYRSGSHYGMLGRLRAGLATRCYYDTEEVRVFFSARAFIEYGLLELCDFAEVPKRGNAETSAG